MPDGGDLRDLPGLTRFGEQLVAAARAPAPRRRWSRRPLGPILVGLVGIATTATATAVALHETVVPAPDPQVLPAAQTPVDTTAIVVAPRAPDPAGGPPWALRLTRSRTGLTCTAVGQERGGVFGIVGEDGVFRAIPVAVSDACGAGALIGGRIVAAHRSADVRTVVYGVTGTGTRRATLITTAGRRALSLGARGTFVVALRGYPEDTAAQVELLGTDGRTTVHPVGARAGIVPDVDGAPAWRLERYALGTRQFCAHLRDARAPAVAPISDPEGGRSSTPTTCIDRRGPFAWAATAVRLRPGDRGRPGFDRWDYHRAHPRTVVLGVARASQLVARVTVLGAGAPRRVVPAPNGTFALLLPARVDPGAISFEVAIRGGRTERGRPGHGTVDDLLASRRAR